MIICCSSFFIHLRSILCNFLSQGAALLLYLELASMHPDEPPGLLLILQSFQDVPDEDAFISLVILIKINYIYTLESER